MRAKGAEEVVLRDLRVFVVNLSSPRLPDSCSLSLAFEIRFALLDEGADAFGEIGLGGALREGLSLALKLRFERMVERALEQRLGAAVDRGRAGGEACRELRRLRFELRRGY